jgi:hypothetical protein
MFASRFNSCIRKSSYRPAGSFESNLQDLGDVTSQAIELLLDVHLAGEKRDLLLEPVGVDVDPELSRTLCGARLYAAAHLGQPRAHGRDPLAQGVTALPQGIAQPRALTAARFVELCDRFRQQRHRLGGDRREIAIGLAHHARPTQHVERADRGGRAAQHLRDFGGALAELGHQRAVEPERGRIRGRAPW